MTIRPSNISQAYKAYVSAPKCSESKTEHKTSPIDRQDRLELSREASGITPQQSIVASLSHEVSAGASAERLAQLKESIANGTYSVLSEKIAAAVLGVEYRI